MKFIFTDQDQEFSDEWESARLSEETAWWDVNGDIYVWTPVYKTEEQQLGAAVHEAFEYLVLCKHNIHNRLACNLVHYAANLIEIVVSLGQTPILYDKSFWTRSKDK